MKLSSKGFSLMNKVLKGSYGFTLIEILIAVGLISILALIGVPNIKKFSSDQQLGDTKSDQIRILREAQFSAMSGTKCSSEHSKAWKVRIDNTGYRLICRGMSANDEQDSAESVSSQGLDSSRPNNSFSSNVSLSSTSCSPAYPADISFNGSSINFFCTGGQLPVTSFTIKLSRGRGGKATVTVNQGGAIF